MTEEFAVMGKRLPRADALEKVKGEAKFASDMELPRMLHSKFLRSPHPHAKITRIDASKAKALPGVKAVLIHKNVPKMHAFASTMRTKKKFEYLLDETVHYAGEEVAAVAAVTREIAEKAIDLIEVEYHVLPAVFDKEEAMKPDAPLVHPELGTNLYQDKRSVNGVLPFEYGDVEEGFADADHIIDGTFESPFQHHVSPEPRAVLCEWIGPELTCWVSTQIPQAIREELSTGLDLPLSNVRVISSNTVGGYGGKQPNKTCVLVAMMARKTGRPVKAQFTRAEDLIATHRRIDAKIYGKVGIKLDGSLTALYTRMITNYGRDSTFGYNIPANAASTTCSMLYNYPTIKFEGYHVITNIQDHGAFNGYGIPESTFCIERLMDEAAEKIGMDPVAFRFKNCTRYGDKATDLMTVAYGPVEWHVTGPDVDSFPVCIEKVAEKACWKDKWKGWTTPVEVNGSKRKGIGIAIGMHHSLSRTPDAATVKMNHDGTAIVLSSDPEIGQGISSAMRQVVAEVLGLGAEDVNVFLADTKAAPFGHGIFGSRGTIAATGSAYYAALDVKKQLFDIAAKKLEASPEDLVAMDRKISVKGSPQKS
ncbi:MAG: xanthine dehydrogenase family protein molybdopterin-binding subunit, partial [Deltaproteobacteria bacterium]|nr:xanthine dehydrogenase family protein molybdopterin-binding subunit [Deltaproteobacteria bacterium]